LTKSSGVTSDAAAFSQLLPVAAYCWHSMWRRPYRDSFY